MSVNGNIGNNGNKRHTSNDIDNDGNNILNTKRQSLVTLVTM